MKNLFDKGVVGKPLTQNELLNLVGGEPGYPGCDAPKQLYDCECNVGCVGLWEGCYDSQSAADAAAESHCSCGGACVAKPHAN